MKYLFLIFSLLFIQLSTWSQFRPQNGVMKSTGDYTAIVNAHIYVSSSEEMIAVGTTNIIVPKLVPMATRALSPPYWWKTGM